MLAIVAVLDHLEHPAKFTSDRAAYEAHWAKKATFKLWKGRISHLMSAHLVNGEVELSLRDEFAISGVMEMASATDRVHGAVLPDSIDNQDLSGALESMKLGSRDAGSSAEEGVMDTKPPQQTASMPANTPLDTDQVGVATELEQRQVPRSEAEMSTAPTLLLSPSRASLPAEAPHSLSGVLVRWPAGSRVTLVGLEKKPQLNGRHCVVLEEQSAAPTRVAVG